MVTLKGTLNPSNKTEKVKAISTKKFAMSLSKADEHFRRHPI